MAHRRKATCLADDVPGHPRRSDRRYSLAAETMTHGYLSDAVNDARLRKCSRAKIIAALI